jgi:hypothetical protein
LTEIPIAYGKSLADTRSCQAAVDGLYHIKFMKETSQQERGGTARRPGPFIE